MSFINFDRDLNWVDVGSGALPYLSNEEAISTNLNVVTNALVPSDVSTAFYYPATTTVVSTSNNCRNAGVNLVGPDKTDGSPYRLRGFISLSDGGSGIVRLLVGIGSLSLTTGPSGDLVINSTPLAVSKDVILIDDLIYVKPFDQLYPGLGYEDRPITFYAHFFAPTGPNTSPFEFSLSAQRLATKPPSYVTDNR